MGRAPAGPNAPRPKQPQVIHSKKPAKEGEANAAKDPSRTAKGRTRCGRTHELKAIKLRRPDQFRELAAQSVSPISHQFPVQDRNANRPSSASMPRLPGKWLVRQAR